MSTFVEEETTADLDHLQECVKAAQKELCEAVQKMFPVGSRISWYHQGIYVQFGTVVRVSDAWWSDMCLTARNERTGKEVTVWLHMQPHRARELPL